MLITRYLRNTLDQLRRIPRDEIVTIVITIIYCYVIYISDRGGAYRVSIHPGA